MTSLGSTWRRWDLHVHTPASFHWSGKKLHEQTPAEQQATWQGIADRMNATDIDAFSIMDYWTFDGYLGFRKFLEQTPTATSKRVFPGIELRMEAPTDHRLNTHVLFDDSVSAEALAHFLARLTIGGPQGRPPAKETFIAIAKGYDAGKLRLHGCFPADKNDDEKMLLLGMRTAVVTRESLLQAVAVVGEERCLIIQPYDTSDGLEELDWKRHPYTDSYLMKMAHIFETRDPVHVALFLGLGHETKQTLGPEFIDNLGGYPKPVVSGSDAHRVQDYGVYPSERVTWLKAQPTFSGIQQVCNEPSLRCFIGISPPKREHIAQNPTKYIDAIHIAKVPGSLLDEHWFDGFALKLNPGLIAIIGNKGSGKSALADILALTGGTHCAEMEFLNDKRFRRGENKAKDFCASVTWADGSMVSAALDQDPDMDQPERVRYLPQQFIENLCNEIASGDETNFERELKKVIFSHVPSDRRLNRASLDELLDYIVGGHRKAITQLQAKLRTLNGDILAVEREMSEETLKGYRTALSLKHTELEAHDKTRPTEEPKPPTDPNDPQAKRASDAVTAAQVELDQLNAKLEAVRTERRVLVARQALLTRLHGHLANFEESYKTFVEDNAEEFTQAGFSLAEIARVIFDRSPIDIGASQVRDRLAEISRIVDGKVEEKGLEFLTADALAALQRLQGELNAPQKRYQAYLAAHGRWQLRRAEIVGTADRPDTIEFLKARIQHAEMALPSQLLDLQAQRLQRVRDIHAELVRIQGAYQELYKPVERVAASSAFAKDALQLSFDAFLAPVRFEDNFLEYIHRNKRGNFYGEDESRKAAHGFVAKYDFNSADNAVAFVSEIMAALTRIEREGTTETVTIQTQLRGNKKLSDLYDFLFGLEYLEPRYTLKLGDKDIAQLSPGEKGALLLVFYLLLDREQIPIIIDQPEQNLDNESVVRLLVDCIRQATTRRQVIIVTHNPNLAVVCDADQIVHVRIDKTDGNRISHSAGAIEDYPINKATVDILEGTYLAFNNRRKKYHKPRTEGAIAPAVGTETGD